jgi:hypothetical protein
VSIVIPATIGLALQCAAPYNPNKRDESGRLTSRKFAAEEAQ